MPHRHPQPISVGETRARRTRVARIAHRLGFVGRVQYQHIYNLTGGAQYGLASSEQRDLLTVYAEAFERDANPEDFSLEAIIAHECGHQMLARHPRLASLVAGRLSLVGEEILASILGAVISPLHRDRTTLLGKAVVELLDRGEQPEVATRLVSQLGDYLEKML
jgi:hypothetical protein